MDKRHKHKKQHAHTQVQTTAVKRPTLTLQKRNELGTLVAALQEIGFKQANNPKEEWEQYLDIQKKLERVMTLEAVLRRPTVAAASRLGNIESFYSWAKEHGVKCEGLTIAEFPGYDLGLKATRDISKDEQLFAIPRTLILSEENLSTEFNKKQFGSMSNLSLAYTLVVEALKPDSFWKPYIDLLPEKYSTVLYFSTEEMAELRGSNVLSTALRQCKAIARQYAFIYNCTQETLSKLKVQRTPLMQLFKQQFNYDLYRWAVSTVMTRENLIPRSPPLTSADQQEQQPSQLLAALIPFWDMANHRDGTVTSFYNPETREMESSAQMDFKSGEQIFIHYGDRSNGDLMIHNGFINPENPKDNVSIKLGLSTTDSLYAKRAQLLELLAIPKHSELKVLPPPIHISSELLAFVRVFNMNEAQLEHWITSDRATDVLHIDCALETSLETKTWQYLQTRLMLLLRVFPTTLEADEERLAQLKNGTLQLPYVQAMLLEYRVLEKRILTAALDYAKQRTKA